MNRIQKTFDRCGKEGKAAYVAYLTMGAPTLEKSFAAAETVVAEGADILELGVPFSDPVADGTVIRQAANVALKNGVTLADVLSGVPGLRQRHPETPIVIFTYYNVIFSYGLKRFAEEAAGRGVDAVLVVDLPLEERKELLDVLRPVGLTFVPLIAPTTGPERVRASAARRDREGHDGTAGDLAAGVGRAPADRQVAGRHPGRRRVRHPYARRGCADRS